LSAAPQIPVPKGLGTMAHMSISEHSPGRRPPRGGRHSRSHPARRVRTR